ncbi:MAG: hypothetical protein K2N05_04530 [Muribaculaceae bacterium]|nr:hypothetical protein [Muribaculaceae bacterium]
MKKYLLLLFLSFISFAGIARSISNVQKDGGWYRMYDENGKQYKSVSEGSYGELKGFSSSIVIFQYGDFLYVYDAELKKIFSGSVGIYGDVISVAGNTFTTKYGNWIYTYDKNGKKINSRVL